MADEIHIGGNPDSTYITRGDFRLLWEYYLGVHTEIVLESDPIVPNGPAGGDLAGTYPNPEIGTEKVSETKLKALSVTTGKLAEGAVTAGKLGAEAVESGKIKLLAITEGLLGPEAVSEGKIKNLAVTAGKLGAEAVETAKIKNLAVTTGKIATEAIIAEKLATGSVIEGKLAANAVTETKIDETYRGKLVQGKEETNLRIVRGIVGSTGTKEGGSGFTSEKKATGEYLVKFNTEYTTPPAVTANAFGAVAIFVVIAEVTKAQARIVTRTVTTTPVLTDSSFHFQVVGS